MICSTLTPNRSGKENPCYTQIRLQKIRILEIRELHNGWLQCGLNDTSNIVYLPPDFSFHRIVKKNFKYKQIHKTVIIKRVIPIYPEVKTHYFGFYGGSERGGHHTFDVSYNDKYIGSLEPLEWK